MKRYRYENILMFFLVIFIYSSCSSNRVQSRNTHTDSKEMRSAGSEIENPEITMSLFDHLRKVPGVSVRGNGNNASVNIRGISSINGSNEPLMVVDGSVITGGVQQVANMIPVNNIERIKVLKNPNEVGIYGARGSNGVIEITTKKN